MPTSSDASSTVVYPIPDVPMYINDIKHYLPHSYPFVMLDRVTSITLDDVPCIEGYKNVSINEEFFQGHFPQHPVMPGVLIIEALAQLSGILAMILSQSTPKNGSNFLFAGMDQVRFKRQIVPGDCLRLQAKLLMQRRGIFKFAVRATVEGILAAQAELVLSHQLMPTTISNSGHTPL